MRLIPLPPCKTADVNVADAVVQKKDSSDDDHFGCNENVVSNPYFDIFNIGNEHPVLLTDFIEILEKKLKHKAVKKLLPMQKGDVYITSASCEKLYNKIGWKPFTPLEEGLEKFATWFLKYSGGASG